MNYQEVEYKLAQYAQWCGNPLRALGYPRCAINARDLPDAVNPDALPDMTDDEARIVGDALLALKGFNAQAHTAITARFLGRLNDDEIGRSHGIGSRPRVHELRIKGYWFLQGRLSV